MDYTASALSALLSFYPHHANFLNAVAGYVRAWSNELSGLATLDNVQSAFRLVEN